MDLIRKITYVGHSRAIILPKGWLESVKNRTGQNISHVKIHLNDVITIEPYFAPQIREPNLSKEGK